MRAFLLLPLLVLAGCFSLDPFLYTPGKTDKYKLEPAGATPEETVTAARIEPVTIAVGEQDLVQAAYVKGSEQPPRAYVIYFHGKGGTLDSSIGRAKRWSNMGFDVLFFDYRGWGLSTNLTPSEATILADTRAVRAWMLGRIGAANADRLVYYGHSLGSATSTQQAEAEPPALLILESAFASIHDFETDSSGLDFPVGFIADAKWPTVDRVKNLHVPILLVHGLADEFVRPEFSQQIYANANEPKQLELVEGAAHGNIPEIMGPANYTALIQSFIATH